MTRAFSFANAKVLCLSLTFAALFALLPQATAQSVPTAELPEQRGVNPGGGGETDDTTTNPTTPVEECQFYNISIVKGDKNSSFIGQNIFDGPGADLSCLTRLVDAALTERFTKLRKDMGANAPGSLDEIRDWIKVWHDDTLENKYGYLDEDLRDFLKHCDDDVEDYFDDKFNDQKAFMDSNCNAIKAQKGQTACNTLKLRWVLSPISLIWYGEPTIREISFTTFPLDPQRSNRWYTWKASARTPLLVYDPTHAGVVQNGAQLFGNHTFGGPQFASLEINSTMYSEKAWPNGYQALATLDQNGDGKISGSELAPLALWFDANSDGQTQPGEIKTLADAGVTVLFYQPDKNDPATGEVSASVGYERIENGKTVTGASVDWWVESAPSKFELIGRQFGRLSESPASAAAPAVFDRSGGEKDPLGRDSVHTVVNGLWKWTIEGDKDYGIYRPQGLLTLSEKDFGMLKGSSYVELPMQPNPAGIKSYITKVPLTGRKETLADGKVKITFELVDKSGAKTRSEGYLSSDGSELSGSSQSTAPAQGGKAGESFTYTWKATRYMPPQ
jgi:hypothetical protein